MITRTKIEAQCIYCHQPLIESDSSIYPLYCSEPCRDETGKALQAYFDDLGNDLGCGG